MKTSRDLQLFINETITPINLFKSELYTQDFHKWQQFLNQQKNEFQLDLCEVLLGNHELQFKQQYLKNFQQLIVILSNKVNHYLYREFKTWATHEHASRIKSCYIHTLDLFENILQSATRQFTDYYDFTVKYTAYSLKSILPELRTTTIQLKLHLIQQPLDTQLIHIVVNGIELVMRSDNFAPVNRNYLTKFTEELLTRSEINNTEMLQFLIEFNFNRLDLFDYLAKINQKIIDNVEGLHEQIESLLHRKDEIKNIKERQIGALLSRHSSIKEDLLQFCEAKSEYLEALLAIQRMTTQDETSATAVFRIFIDLTVKQFALFIRLLFEGGILAENELTQHLFKFMARHFYNKKTPFMSWSNLQKKSTDIDFSTALHVYEILISMARWLETNFNVKNYRNSLN